MALSTGVSNMHLSDQVVKQNSSHSDPRGLIVRWKEALLSGNFAQGRGKLREGEKYCCLGVLCETAGLEFRESPDTGYYNEEGELVWQNLWSNPKIPGQGKELDESIYRCLASLNDAGLSFEGIALLLDNLPTPKKARAVLDWLRRTDRGSIEYKDGVLIAKNGGEFRISNPTFTLSDPTRSQGSGSV